MDLISIIIPVYKVEPYLNCCIESIVNQTYQNLEIILVDDGSPDNCPAMCDEWERKDGRIRVVHQANRGSAHARNIALDIASGDYIAFVDSDDMMSPVMLETLYKIICSEKADIVECGFSLEENGVEQTVEDNHKIKYYTAKEALQEHINNQLFRQLIWNKLYSRAVIGNIRFAEGRFIDDEFWTYKVIGNAQRLVSIPERLYYYRQQQESVMHQCYSLKRLDAIAAHCERYEYVKEMYTGLADIALLSIWYDCRYQGQMSIKYLEKKEKKEAFEYLEHILKMYQLSWQVILKQSLKEKIWLTLEKISLKAVCSIRNCFDIGF